MKRWNENRKWLQPIAAGTVVLAVMAMVLGGKNLYPLGSGSVIMTDMYSQYIPLLYHFYDVVTGAKGMFVDMTLSGGAPVYVDTINEILNPFNYVLLLFGREEIWRSVNVLLVCYVTGAAVSMGVLLGKWYPENSVKNVLLAVCYALGGFGAYSFQIIKWMYFPVLFPLFLLAFGRMRKGKSTAFSLLLAYQLALSIQLGFMTLLFVFFAGAWLLYGTKKVRSDGGWDQEARENMAVRIVFGTMKGLLLSAPVWLPNLWILLDSSRAGNLSYLSVMKQHGLDDLFERLFYVFHPVLFVLAVRKLFCHWKEFQRGGAGAGQSAAGAAPRAGRLGQRAAGVIQSAAGTVPSVGFWGGMTAFLGITVLLQPANLLWHMGSYVCFPVRYGYMFSACLVCWLASGPKPQRSLQSFLRRGKKGADRERSRRSGVAAAGVCLQGTAFLLLLAAVWLVCKEEAALAQAFSTLSISASCPRETVLVLVICGLVTLAVCACLAGTDRASAAAADKRTGRESVGKLLFLAGGYGLILYGMFLLPEENLIRQWNAERYALMQDIRETMGTEDTAGMNGQAVVRIRENEVLPLNSALVTGIPSLSGYLPTGNGRFQAAMEGLGYLTPWVSTTTAGGTAFSDWLLGVGLSAEIMGAGGEAQSVVLEAKEYGAPVRYALRETEVPPAAGLVIAQAEAAALQPQAGEGTLQNQSRYAEILLGEGSFPIWKGEELPLTEQGDRELPVSSRQLWYVETGLPASQLQIFVNGSPVTIPEGASSESPHRVYALGRSEGSGEEPVTVSVRDQAGNPVSTEQMVFGALDVDRLAQFEKNCGKLPVQMEQKGNQIRIQTTAGADGVLFLPISHLKGWQCLKEGKKVEIQTLFGGFMGIGIEGGTSVLTLSYRPEGLNAGLCLAGAGIVLLLAGMLRQTGERRMGAALLRGYRWLAVLAILLVYVIPCLGLVLFMGWKMVRSIW